MNDSKGLIRLRGVRHNNLKGFDLDLPRGKFIAITGLSGSGKSSLAFDTLYAEGQRRYIETFSPYARQFFDRMDKPQVDSVQGIPPAIAIEQCNTVKSTRSTVGTMTELADYMKLLWPNVAQLYCRQCATPVRKDPPLQIWNAISEAAPGEVFIAFDLPLSTKLSLAETAQLIEKQGYQRVLLDGKVLRISELPSSSPEHTLSRITVVQDRLRIHKDARSRFVEACENAYHFGKGKLTVHLLSTGKILPFSKALHCADCNLSYAEPAQSLFSFNHPAGACSACRGFGRTISIDFDLAIPNRGLSIAEGVVKPWQTGKGAECQHDLLKFCRIRGVPTEIPFRNLPEKWQQWVIQGDPGYGSSPDLEWPNAWYGIRGYFQWLESKAYKMHVRVLLSRYRRYRTCAECGGKRFCPDSLLYRVAFPPSVQSPNDATQAPVTLADFYDFTVDRALEFISSLREATPAIDRSDQLRLVANEIQSRLQYLKDVGLGYLTLDRPTRSLSGGETERVNLTTCLGSRLVNTLFVLDEPTVGLHPRDTDKLIRIVQQLQKRGNTVVVVEHEASVMRSADQIIDLGPGQGRAGGDLVFQGSYNQILNSSASLTGAYLSGRKTIPLPRRRPVNLPRLSEAALELKDFAPGWPAPIRLKSSDPAPSKHPCLRISNATRHNLQDFAVTIPLERFVCITGVSGSGKTTLIREILVPALLQRLASGESLATQTAAKLADQQDEPGDSGRPDCEVQLEGIEGIERVVLVDQSPIGRTPRSNPALYTGAFEGIRELFAQSHEAKKQKLEKGIFSFNSARGQCERCRGAGFEKIEMQFLSDVFIRCPSCDGRRYRAHVLTVRISPPQSKSHQLPNGATPEAKNIAEVLDLTVDDAVLYLESFKDSKAALKAVRPLKLLKEVGLGYLRLGQPVNTLSGGESQRLKLASFLAEPCSRTVASSRTLFVFDEPTTGLHFADTAILIEVFQKLVNSGHSVLVVEHNIDLIKSADWVIDLGPEAGHAGGQLVAQGTPEDVAACPRSHTGQALRNSKL